MKTWWSNFRGDWSDDRRGGMAFLQLFCLIDALIFMALGYAYHQTFDWVRWACVVAAALAYLFIFAYLEWVRGELRAIESEQG